MNEDRTTDRDLHQTQATPEGPQIHGLVIEILMSLHREIRSHIENRPLETPYTDTSATGETA
jgi:hypothetical protein